MAGRIGGKYELLALLGRGGCGEVWRARDVELDRVVALKLLQRTTPEDVGRFRREAHAVARLNHPNIAQLYEFGGEPPHLAMQFVEGEPISKPDHLAAAARAVHYAHEQGILHRDLKPANILVDGGGRAFVLDFGLAREVKGEQTAMSVTGDILGTPSYMAPEQARGDVAHLDVRADVYGLGATLYALLEGRPPHTGPTAYEVVRKVIEEDPAAPKGELGVIAMKALEKDPVRRYGSAAEFADDLDRHFRNEPIVARPASMGYRLRKQIQRRPAVWRLAATLTAAILAGAAFGVYQLAAVARERGRRIETQERLLTQQREATERERLLRVLEASSRRLRELEDELARFIEGAELAAVYGDAEQVVRTLSAELNSHPEEGMALHFLKGEALRLMAREEESIAEYTAALEAPETEWARGAQVRARAAMGRGLARLGRAMDLPLGGTPGEREARRREAEAMVPAIEADLALAKAEAGLPVRVRRLVDLWGAMLRLDRETVLRGTTEEIGKGGRVEGFYFLRGVARRGPESLADLTACIDRHAGLWRAWFHRGNARGGSGDIEGAASDFRRAAELNPREPMIRNNLGNALAMLGRREEAIACFDAILEADPRNPAALVNRGNVRCGLGDYPGAVADYDLAASIDERYAEAFSNRGSAREALGEMDAAMADWARALEIDGDCRSALLNRGCARAERGDLRGALEDFDRLVALEPGNPENRYNRGLARRNAGNAAGAAEDFRAALEHAPPGWPGRIDVENLLRAAERRPP